MSHFSLASHGPSGFPQNDPMASIPDKYSLSCSIHYRWGPGLWAGLQWASRLTIILHFFNSLSPKSFSSFVSLSYLYHKLSRDILFRSEHNGAPKFPHEHRWYSFLNHNDHHRHWPFHTTSQSHCHLRLLFWEPFHTSKVLKWLSSFWQSEKLATIQGQSFSGTGKLLKSLLLVFQS